MKRVNDHHERIRDDVRFRVPALPGQSQKERPHQKELHQVIERLTGYSENTLRKPIEDDVTFEQFFERAKLNPNAHLITGVICGHRIEEIDDPLTRQVRYLDKLVDELAKGRKTEKTSCDGS